MVDSGRSVGCSVCRHLRITLFACAGMNEKYVPAFWIRFLIFYGFMAIIGMVGWNYLKSGQWVAMESLNTRDTSHDFEITRDSLSHYKRMEKNAKK